MRETVTFKSDCKCPTLVGPTIIIWKNNMLKITLHSALKSKIIFFISLTSSISFILFRLEVEIFRSVHMDVNWRFSKQNNFWPNQDIILSVVCLCYYDQYTAQYACVYILFYNPPRLKWPYLNIVLLIIIQIESNNRGINLNS